MAGDGSSSTKGCQSGSASGSIESPFKKIVPASQGSSVLPQPSSYTNVYLPRPVFEGVYAATTIGTEKGGVRIRVLATHNLLRKDRTNCGGEIALFCRPINCNSLTDPTVASFIVLNNTE